MINEMTHLAGTPFEAVRKIDESNKSSKPIMDGMISNRPFRTLKSDLRLRPLYHRKDHRIEGQINIAIIAYYFVHYIRTKLSQHQRQDSWQSIQGELNSWQRITVRLSKSRQRQIEIAVDANPQDFNELIRNHMGLEKSNHLVKKIVTLR